MAIPSRLSRTTLGDVLGELSRDRVSGTLELIETARNGSVVHEIVFVAGAIASVHSSTGRTLIDHLGCQKVQAPPAGLIGEHLVKQGVVSTESVTSALDAQRRERLDALFSLREAEIRFRPRCKSRRPREPEPMVAAPLLRGRPRSRDRFQTDAPRARALRTLGLGLHASPSEIRRAFRALALKLHPDQNPSLSGDAKLTCIARFSELSRAYHRLIA